MRGKRPARGTWEDRQLTSIGSLSRHLETHLTGYLNAYVGEVTPQQSLLLEDLTLENTALASVAKRREGLEPLMNLRLAAEIALRISWISADIETHPSTVTSKVDRMRKLDLVALREAYKGIHALTDEATPLLAELQAKIDEIEGPAAPSGAGNLVVRKDAKGLYSAYRLCSAMIHAGNGARRGRIMPEARIWAMAIETSFVAVTLGSACLAALAGTYPDAWPSEELRALMGHYQAVSDAGLLD